MPCPPRFPVPYFHGPLVSGVNRPARRSVSGMVWSDLIDSVWPLPDTMPGASARGTIIMRQTDYDWVAGAWVFRALDTKFWRAHGYVMPDLSGPGIFWQAARSTDPHLSGHITDLSELSSLVLGYSAFLTETVTATSRHFEPPASETTIVPDVSMTVRENSGFLHWQLL